MSIKTAIIGASGYTGAELLRLLVMHPEFSPVVVTGDSQAGQSVVVLYPHLSQYSSMRFSSMDDCQDVIDECELVFSCLPHGHAMGILPKLQNRFVVDLASDFRLSSSADYEMWYGKPHCCPQELSSWAYGMPELFKDNIVANGARIANPGCYATACILANAPLVANGLVDNTIVIDAISGTSGAGRGAKPALHFAHVYEDVRAYKIGNHQHIGEVEIALNRLSSRLYSSENSAKSLQNDKLKVCLSAQLAPMSRGIYAISSAQLTKDVDTKELQAVFSSFYREAPFVRLVDSPPGTKEVRGSNFVYINAQVDKRTGRVIVTSAIDNLVKGAAGQAIQNANIICSLDETTGLNVSGLYP